MKFSPDDIRIEPGHCARTWQSCNYYVGNVELFHHRTGMRSLPRGHQNTTLAGLAWLAGGKDWESCWINGVGTRAEIQALADKWGGEACECFYAPEGADDYFLSFDSEEKAIVFCQSEDFDRLCLSGEKLVESAQ